MLKKLKEKAKEHRKILIFFALFLLLGSGFFVPQKTLATTYDASAITLQVDTQVNGKNDNFARVGKDGNLQFSVVLTLTQPSQLVLGSDKLDFQKWSISDRAIVSFGSGIKPVQSNGGDYPCETLKFSSGVQDVGFLGCKFVDAKGSNAVSTLKAGDQILKADFSVSGSNLQKLGITTVSTTSANEFYAYPLVVFDSSAELWQQAVSPAIAQLVTLINGEKPITYSPGKSFFVELYETDKAAKTADKNNDPRPGNVPGYGSTQATGQIQDTGSGLLGLFNKVIGFLIGLLDELLYLIFAYLIAPLIQATLSIRTYSDTFAAVIYPGWIVVRNLCNILFIVALIAIGLGTLFRVESYQYKHLLVQLIIAALLVNFSLVIAQAVLGVADTMQAQFLPSNLEVIRSLAKNLMLSYRSDVWGKGLVASGTFADTVKPIFFLALGIGSFMVFLAIGAFLVIRIVMLWILLMISPIAYAAGILPTTTQYRTEWWKTFLKYAFFTPIMAFFLNMTAIMANNIQGNPIFEQISSDPTLISSSGSGFASFVVNVSSNILLLVFLIVSLKVAEQAGIYGASTISGWAKKGMFAPFKVAKVGAERAFEGLQNVTGVTLDPRLWAAKWKEYSEREKGKRLEKRASTDIGIPGARFSGSAKLGLGSPLDFYKNFANWQGAKRIGKNLAKTSGKAFKEMKDKEKNLDLLKKEGALMSAEGLAGTTAEWHKSKDELEKKLKAAKDLDQEKKGLKTKLANLDADAERLTKDYKAATSDEDKQKIKQDLDIAEQERERTRAEIAEKAEEIEKLGLVYNQDGSIKEDEFIENSSLGKLQSLNKQLEDKLNKDNDKMVEVLNDPAGADFQRFANDAAKEAFIKNTIKTANEDFKKAQVAYYARELPKAYHARAARQHLEAEEEKKVADIKNWPEKVQVFLTAQAENNPYLAAACLKSLAKDSNFNEITEALGYDSSAEGLKQFFEKEYRDKFGMTEHEMMEVATEVGYVNEDTGWWNMARVSSIDNHGHLNWSVDTKKDGKWASYLGQKLNVDFSSMGNKEREKMLMDYKPVTQEEYDIKWGPQNHEISVEMEKRGPRLIANFARTSFVNQTLGPDGHMSTGVHAAGWKILNSMSKTPNMRYEFSRMLRPNTAEAIAMTKEWTWENCKNRGVDREIYEKVCQMGGKPIRD